MGSSMKIKTVLMTSAAALALTTNALAGQGDTYVSIFGGISTLADTDLLHYQLNTASTSDLTWRARNVFNLNSVNVLRPSHTYKSEKTNPTATPTRYEVTYTDDRTFLLSFSRTGTSFLGNHVDYQREFQGSVGTDGWVVGASIGVELFQGLRGEVEVAFRNFDLDAQARVNRATYLRTRTQLDGTRHYDRPIFTETTVEKHAGTPNDPYNLTATGTVGTYTRALVDGAVVTKTLTSTVASSINVLRYNRFFHTQDAAAIADGELSSFSFMANLWYDFPLGDTGIVPFVGVGIGMANLTLDYSMKQINPSQGSYVNNLAATSTGPFTNKFTVTVDAETSKRSFTFTGTKQTIPHTFVTSLKTDQAVIAYQFGAGIGYEFGNGTRLTAQYRYFSTEDADFGPVTVGVETTDVLVGLVIPFGRGR